MRCLICGDDHPRSSLYDKINEHLDYKRFRCSDCNFGTCYQLAYVQHCLEKDHLQSLSSPTDHFYLKHLATIVFDDFVYAEKHGFKTLEECMPVRVAPATFEGTQGICLLCDRKPIERRNVHEHIQQHLGYRPHRCMDCRFTTEKTSKLDLHRRQENHCVKFSDSHPYLERLTEIITQDMYFMAFSATLPDPEEFFNGTVRRPLDTGNITPARKETVQKRTVLPETTPVRTISSTSSGGSPAPKRKRSRSNNATVQSTTRGNHIRFPDTDSPEKRSDLPSPRQTAQAAQNQQNRAQNPPAVHSPPRSVPELHLIDIDNIKRSPDSSVDHGRQFEDSARPNQARQSSAIRQVPPPAAGRSAAAVQPARSRTPPALSRIQPQNNPAPQQPANRANLASALTQLGQGQQRRDSRPQEAPEIKQEHLVLHTHGPSVATSAPQLQLFKPTWSQLNDNRAISLQVQQNEPIIIPRSTRLPIQQSRSVLRTATFGTSEKLPGTRSALPKSAMPIQREFAAPTPPTVVAAPPASVQLKIPTGSKKTLPQKSSPAIPRSRCNLCGDKMPTISVDYVSRRSHVIRAHMKASAEEDQEGFAQMLEANLRRSFPNELVCSDDACLRCGTRCKTQDQRRKHYKEVHHVERCLRCPVNGCVTDKITPQELREHINKHKNPAATSEEGRAFEKLSKEYNEEIKTAIAECFPIDARCFAARKSQSAPEPRLIIPRLSSAPLQGKTAKVARLTAGIDIVTNLLKSEQDEQQANQARRMDARNIRMDYNESPHESEAETESRRADPFPSAPSPGNRGALLGSPGLAHRPLLATPNGSRGTAHGRARDQNERERSRNTERDQSQIRRNRWDQLPPAFNGGGYPQYYYHQRRQFTDPYNFNRHPPRDPRDHRAQESHRDPRDPRDYRAHEDHRNPRSHYRPYYYR